MAKEQIHLEDKEILWDCYDTQCALSQEYSAAASKTVDAKHYDALMTLLAEEHQITMDMLSELNKRDWHSPEAAKPEQVQKLYQRMLAGMLGSN